MNEKYDIKGSWVARSADPPVDGQKITCTICEQQYIYRKRKRLRRRITTRVNSYE